MKAGMRVGKSGEIPKKEKDIKPATQRPARDVVVTKIWLLNMENFYTVNTGAQRGKGTSTCRYEAGFSKIHGQNSETHLSQEKPKPEIVPFISMGKGRAGCRNLVHHQRHATWKTKGKYAHLRGGSWERPRRQVNS